MRLRRWRRKNNMKKQIIIDKKKNTCTILCMDLDKSYKSAESA